MCFNKASYVTEFHSHTTITDITIVSNKIYLPYLYNEYTFSMDS